VYLFDSALANGDAFVWVECVTCVPLMELSNGPILIPASIQFACCGISISCILLHDVCGYFLLYSLICIQGMGFKVETFFLDISTLKANNFYLKVDFS
jgi:hypothetical protein